MTNPALKFSYGRSFIIGFGFLGISVIWPIFNQFIPLFLQAGNPVFAAQLQAQGLPPPDVLGFGLSPSLALFIMTWDNLLNVFIQPWVGARSDHTWNRFGRRKPWMMAGVPLAVAGFILIPLVPPAWGAAGVLAIAVFILITNFGMAIFRSPTVAWLGDLFLPEERSKANSIINLMGGVGTVLALVIGGYLFDAAGRTAPFWAGAALLVVATLVALIKVEEHPAPAGEIDRAPPPIIRNQLADLWRQPGRNGFKVLLSIGCGFMAYEALNTGLSSFAVFSLGLPAGFSARLIALAGIAYILAAVPMGLLGTRFGRQPVILTAVLGLTAIFFAGYFAIQGAFSFAIALILTGLLWSAVNVNTLPLVFDFGDESRIGAYTGLYYFFTQTASVLGPASGGLVVDLLGDQYRWLFLFATLFMVFSFWALFKVDQY